MELDQTTKRAVRELGDAINSAVENSMRVSEAIESLREIGFEPHLNLKLEIALQTLSLNKNRNGGAENFELELTDDDLQTLRRMKIKF
jgi:hypothetical protein